MALRDDLDPLETQLERAWDSIARGDFEAAMRSAEQSLEIDDACPEAHNLVGYIHAAGGNLEEALACYRRAIEHDEEYLEPMLNAAEVLLQLGDPRGAIEQLDVAIPLTETADERADAMLLRIDALLAAGESELAEAAVRELPEGPFDSPHLDFLVGRAYFEVGDVDAAAIFVEHAAAALPQDPEATYYSGLVRDARGDRLRATAAFLQTRDLDRVAPRAPWSESLPRFERRVRAAMGRLPENLALLVDGALVLVDVLPGAEVVSEGLDPRVPLWIDDLPLGDGQTLRRVFVYQQNVERLVPAPEYLEGTIRELLTEELRRVFVTDPRKPTTD